MDKIRNLLILQAIITVALGCYAAAITPLAYRDARRELMAWAAEQDDFQIAGISIDRLKKYAADLPPDAVSCPTSTTKKAGGAK